MTREEHIHNLCHAMRAIGFNTDIKSVDLILELNDLVKDKKGDITIKDITKAEQKVLAKYNTPTEDKPDEPKQDTK